MGTEHNNRPRQQKPNTVLVCFAVPEEAAPFKSRARNKESIVVLVTGMGGLNAQQSFVNALETCHPTLVITSGFAGGLNPALRQGEIVGNWDPEFPISIVKGSEAKLIRFHCSDVVISQARQKRFLFEAGRGDAVEMESQIIRKECAIRGIPSATLRIVLDVARESLALDFEEVLDSHKRIVWAKFAVWLLKHPSAIPKLIAFNKQVRACARKLSDSLWAALRQGIPELGPCSDLSKTG